MRADRHRAQAVGEHETETGRPRDVDVEMMRRPVAGHLRISMRHVVVDVLGGRAERTCVRVIGNSVIGGHRAEVRHVVLAVHPAADLLPDRLGQIGARRLLRREHQNHRKHRGHSTSARHRGCSVTGGLGVDGNRVRVEAAGERAVPDGDRRHVAHPRCPFCGANPVLSVVRMVTTFSENKKNVLKRSTYMRFTFTHPMHTHPYNPELVTGDGIATVAAAAEAAGFHGFGFTDHPAPTQRWLEAGGHDALDPFVAMGYAAARTTTLRLIPNLVVLPYRNPFVVAKSGATLDLLSGGRFTLGVGVGYLKREFAALGVDFDERAGLFEEALEVIRGIWTTDDYSYDGRHFTAKGITAHPRPVSTPHPPIWIGGNTAAARKRVVMYGDGWCPFPAPAMLAQTARTAVMDSDGLAAGIDDLRQRFDAADRDFSGIDVTFTNADGGSPGSDDFNADAYLAGLEKLATIGVTWVQVGLPGDSLTHLLETIERFGTSVISAPP